MGDWIGCLTWSLLRPTLSPSIVCVAGQFTVAQTFLAAHYTTTQRPVNLYFSSFVSDVPIKPCMISTHYRAIITAFCSPATNLQYHML